MLYVRFFIIGNADTMGERIRRIGQMETNFFQFFFEFTT
jgi:hypothetical protein